MNAAAIICEYNPMTNGHIRQIEAVKKETNCDTIICVMSGSFTQHGDACIMDKFQRAEIAVRSGVDMVVELPLIYSLSSAEEFAYGALKTINSLPNVTTISFGSECGDVELLTKTAEFLLNEPDSFKEILHTYLGKGLTYPKAISSALEEFVMRNSQYADIQHVMDSPNNILGVSYIMAAKKFNKEYTYHTIQREDNDTENELQGEYPSAKAIRNALRQKKYDEIEKFVPTFSFESLKLLKNVNQTTMDDLCLFKMKTINGYDLATYHGVDARSGMHNKMQLSALDSVTYQEYLDKAKTKSYTLAKIKRATICALFDLSEKQYQEYKSLPTYIFVLALRKDRKDILTELTASCPNVLIRNSDIDKVDKSLRPMIKLDIHAQGTLSLINKTQTITKSFILV